MIETATNVLSTLKTVLTSMISVPVILDLNAQGQKMRVLGQPELHGKNLSIITITNLH